MNHPTDHQLDALFSAARAQPRSTEKAQFGFETRLLARIREERSSPSLFILAWRLAPIFAALAIVATYWGVWGGVFGGIRGDLRNLADQQEAGWRLWNATGVGLRQIDADAEVLRAALDGADDRLLMAYMTGDSL